MKIEIDDNEIKELIIEKILDETDNGYNKFAQDLNDCLFYDNQFIEEHITPIVNNIFKENEQKIIDGIINNMVENYYEKLINSISEKISKKIDITKIVGNLIKGIKE